MEENLAEQAVQLYSEGSSFGQISETLDVSKSRVGGLIRDGIEALKNSDEPIRSVLDETESRTALELKNDSEDMQERQVLEHSIFEEDKDINEILERTFLIKATPILRKVALNSKVFMQHEYIQRVLGYEGDVGDLLVEALDYYWEKLGFTIKITHDMVV